MVSRAFFSLYVDGTKVGDFSADLKQSVGSEFKDANIEVGPPNGYEGPFDHEHFSAAARTYFRDLIGPEGRELRVRAARMFNNRIGRDREFKF
jgi:hypothetical protein